MNPIFIICWTISESFWGSFWGPKVFQNGVQQVTKNGTSFGTAPSAEVGNLAKPAFCEAVGKVPGACKCTQQKKGRDEGLMKPLKAL